MVEVQHSFLLSLPSSPCTMPPIRTTDPNGHQDSAGVAHPGARPSRLDYASMPTLPCLLHPLGSSTHQCPKFQPAMIRPPRSGNSILVASSQSIASSTRSTMQPSHISHYSLPTPQSHDDPVHNLLHAAGGSILQCHGPQPPIRPHGSESNMIDALQCAAHLIPSSDQHLRQPLHRPLHAPQSYGDPVEPRVHEATTTSFLAGASGFRMRDIHYHDAPHITVNRGGVTGDNAIDGWDLLLKKTAPNALHNSRARFDAPKCDEDTRVEVTSELMEWIEDRQAPQRLLCMTGAAGSGKSCLQQTAAEICTSNDILAASFFLSAADVTRNTVDPVIPTIAYQLGRGNPTLKWLIKAAIERDPLIFDQSLHAQTIALIVRPVEGLRDMGTDLMSLPYVILIDGLDEGRGVDRQAELLTAIRRCLLVDSLPFRIFIASRPEWAIHSALQPGGHLRDMAYHIQLSDKYDATADMRRYLRRRFEDIGLRINNPDWFSEDNIETLVQAGSGQFIYVATVYKYISDRRASPAARLNVVLTWTPHAGQAAKPFEALDRLYYNVLSAAKDIYEGVDTHHGRDFLLLLRTQLINCTGFLRGSMDYPADDLSVLLNLEAQAEEALISDLRSLAVLELHNGTLRLRLYHKSFSDFLEQPSRAKDLFVPESLVYTHLAKCLIQRIIEFPLEFDPLPANWEDLPLSKRDRKILGYYAFDLPRVLASSQTALGDIDNEIVGFTQNGGWQKINNLLPLLIRSSMHDYFSHSGSDWANSVQILVDKLKDRKPETAAVISKFLEKWKKDFGPQWEEFF